MKEFRGKMDGNQDHQNYIPSHFNVMNHDGSSSNYQQQSEPASVSSNPPVNFSAFTPDPNVSMYQGHPYPPQLSVLTQNPMPLLPTEPIPQTNLKGEKKKTSPTKKPKKEVPIGQVPFKKIPEYVHKLLEKRHPDFHDKDFAERALSNLARKLASQALILDEWLRGIYQSDPNSGCAPILRPKDGRMTITKATGNAGCKKVFPQIFVCQLFRWPQIVFHHDIKSSNYCQHPGVIKPNSEMKEEWICVNPYHYDLTMEARIKKQPIKPSCSATRAENEAKEEFLPYEDDGVDYIKLWDERSIKPRESGKQEIQIDDLMKELKFFVVNRDTKKINPAENEILTQSSIVDELKSILMSGAYRKRIENGPDIVKKSQTNEKDIALMPPPDLKVKDNACVEEEDSAIQNLLDDIRGSFERQFDDEFNDLTDTAADEERSRSSSPFGNINIGPTFTMSDEHSLEDLAVSAEDILASSEMSPDEMPLEGWTMSQEVFDNFLEAASTSTGGDQFNFSSHNAQHQDPNHQHNPF